MFFVHFKYRSSRIFAIILHLDFIFVKCFAPNNIKNEVLKPLCSPLDFLKIPICNSLHYEKFADGSVKCIEKEIPFDLPEGWNWSRLRNIAQVKGGKRIPKGMGFSPDKTAHAYIRVSDMKNHSINLNDLKYITDEVHSKIKNYIISKNDLYITIAGTIGVAGAVPDELDGMNLTENAAKVTEIKLDKAFLCLVLQCEFVQQQFQDKTHQVAMPKLALERILSILIPVCPLREQMKICSTITNLDFFLSAIEKEKNNLVKVVSAAKSKILDLAIRGKLVPQDPNNEPASILLERIREEKEELIKAGKLKRDKKESVIFRGEDNSYYEKIGEEVRCIDQEISYEIPKTWTWVRLANCCCKEIKRGKSPKYAKLSNTLVFAQKCNRKYSGIDVTLAQYLDENMLSKYDAYEYIQDKDIVVNSTGTGTLGRVGLYRTSANYTGLPIVPDSHITVIRACHSIHALYLYIFMKANQAWLEKKGEGSTNQKELKPITLKDMLVPIPPYSTQKRIVTTVEKAFSSIASVEESLN